MKFFCCFFLLAVLLQACDPFEYHPYEVRLGKEYRDLNRKYIERIRMQDVGADTFRFAFLGDSQRWYDETEDFVADVNARDDIDFVIHGGDISDFGMSREFCLQHDILKKLKVPYVTILGNHDVLGTGFQVFRIMYGEYDFSFEYGNTRFVCLNTNALDFDYETPVPNFQFIRKDLADSTARSTQTIALMHTPPEDVVFNNDVKDIFHEHLKQYPNLLFCVHAHQHKLKERDLFGDGVMYYGCDCMKNRNYLLFTVTKDGGYEHEVVYF